MIDHGIHGRRIGAGPPGYTEADLVHGRPLDQALSDHLVSKTQMPQVKHLHLGLDTNLGITSSHSAQHIGRLHVNIVGVIKIDRATVQGGDIRTQQFNVRHALLGSDQVGALCRHLRVIVINNQITSHASRQIDQHITATISDPFDHILEQFNIATAFPGLRVPHMQVHDRCPGVCRLNS